MKIEHIQQTAAATAVTGERRAETAGVPTKQAGAAQAEPSTQVELSQAASLLSRASEDPTFDMAKIERITKAIEENKFTVDADAIAQKMLSIAQDMLGGGNGNSKAH